MRNDTAFPATDLCARGMLEQLDCRTLWDCGSATNSLLGRARAARKHGRERKREKSSFQRFVCKLAHLRLESAWLLLLHLLLLLLR